MSQFAAVEAQVRELHAHYADAVFRRDFHAFGECFALDAEWRIAGMVLRGRTQIVEAFSRIMADARRVFMTFRSPLLRVEGVERACARTYLTEQCSWQDGRSNYIIGRYFEHFIREDERWRFSWRLYQVLYTGPRDMSGSWFDEPDFGPPPAMPPRDCPPPPHRRAAE
jgi:ketosteroid isomerase-like protein